MNKKAAFDYFGFILLVILLTAVCIVLITLVSNSQDRRNLENLCIKCGYSKMTDMKPLLPFSIIPVAEQIECDGSRILEIHYAKKETKWHDEIEYDWNRPEVDSC